MSFVTPVDIINRGLQHLGAVRITALTDNSKNAAEASFIYDKLRRAELRANLWNFSARRAVLRPYKFGSSWIWQPVAWNNTITYARGAIVSFGGLNWVNVNDVNLGLTPGSGAPYIGWQEFLASIVVNTYDSSLTYYPGELYYAPVATLPGLYLVGNIFNVTYLVPTSMVAPYNIFAPTGLTTNLLPAAKSAYPLPYSYLRPMPQDPKTPAAPAQLSTAGMQLQDYEFENGFLLSNSTNGGPIVFRFAADLQTVVWFDDMFCEALAARIGLELNEILTQSPQKAQLCNGLYEEAIAKAMRINAIEAGSTEPDQDKVAGNRGPTRERLPPQPQPRQQ